MTPNRDPAWLRERAAREDGLSPNTSGHFMKKCSCGVIIAQCRCPGPKAVEIVERGCASCKENK